MGLPSEKDLSDFDLPCNFEYFERKSKAAFKKIIDKKSKELASDKFIKFRASHSKMKNLQYDELKLQKYLKQAGAELSQAWDKLELSTL